MKDSSKDNYWTEAPPPTETSGKANTEQVDE